MKKLFITALIAAGISTLNAQTTLYTGNGSLSSTRSVYLSGHNLTFYPTSGSFFINGSNGNTGIGTTLPSEKLDVNGTIKGVQGYFTKTPVNGQTFATNTDRVNASMIFSAGPLTGTGTQVRTLNFLDFPQSNMDSSPTVWFSINNRNDWTRLRFRAVQDGESEFYLYDKIQQTNFYVHDDGNDNVSLIMPKVNSKVGIGTDSFTDGTDTYSLSVNGNVRANRVKVYTNWADYVFEENYKLPTLEEVEKQIKTEGHLKDIPSAEEVEKNGIELGEMNKLLLQKVEELTLYTIAQKKENDKQQQEIQDLKNQVEKLLNNK